MDPLIGYVLWPAVCYFAGATPFGWLMGWLHGIDIREHGSRNPGATNVWRVLGARAGLFVFVLDAVKGFVPTLAAGQALLADGADAGSPEYHLARILCVLGAVLGHVFTFWLRFHGGKGVATALGGLLAVWPELTLPGLLAFGLWGVVLASFRYVSLASIAAAACFPLLFWWLHRQEAFGSQWPLLALSVLIAGVLIAAHAANIQRLLAGTERRIGQSAEPASAGDPQA